MSLREKSMTSFYINRSQFYYKILYLFIFFNNSVQMSSPNDAVLVNVLFQN